MITKLTTTNETKQNNHQFIINTVHEVLKSQLRYLTGKRYYDTLHLHVLEAEISQLNHRTENKNKKLRN